MNYLEGIQTLVERANVFADRDICINVISNPVAGGFAIKRNAKKNEAFFNAALELVSSRAVVTRSCTITLYRTNAAGHARDLARAVLDLAVKTVSANVLFLIITAGGDGTSLEVQTELANSIFQEKQRNLSERVCLLRLPFGTGNDGSDGRTLDESLSLLTDNSVFFSQRAIRVFANGKSIAPWYAFNIASIGLDAFVTYMTNNVKGFFPGDFYKIWVDIACLFYNRLYHIGRMQIDATTTKGSAVFSHSDRMILYAMGVTGYRTYGSNQKILPNEHNVCGMREMPIARKLAIKKNVKNGTHISFPEVMLYSADKLVFEYSEQILVQLDGETHLLYPSDFPLTFERTEPFITILKAANSKYLL